MHEPKMNCGVWSWVCTIENARNRQKYGAFVATAILARDGAEFLMASVLIVQRNSTSAKSTMFEIQLEPAITSKSSADAAQSSFRSFRVGEL
jgi:hypothetical protein